MWSLFISKPDFLYTSCSGKFFSNLKYGIQHGIDQPRLRKAVMVTVSNPSNVSNHGRIAISTDTIKLHKLAVLTMNTSPLSHSRKLHSSTVGRR